MPRVRVMVAIALCSLLAAPAAVPCTRGYSYAGLYAPRTSTGIAATLTMLHEPTVSAGHVAAWVGVGGPRVGPNGADEWLQVGFASFPGSAGAELYYELAQPGHAPEYHELAPGIGAGDRVRASVLELPFARDTWVVVTSRGMAGPFYLPKSHSAWAPIATAESWNAGGASCNRYAYLFDGVQLERPDGSWKPLRHGLKLLDPGPRLRRTDTSSFSVSAP